MSVVVNEDGTRLTVCSAFLFLIGDNFLMLFFISVVLVGRLDGRSVGWTREESFRGLYLVKKETKQIQMPQNKQVPFKS